MALEPAEQLAPVACEEFKDFGLRQPEDRIDRARFPHGALGALAAAQVGSHVDVEGVVVAEEDLRAKEGAHAVVLELRLLDVLVAKGEVRKEGAARAQLALRQALIAPRLHHRGHLPPKRRHQPAAHRAQHRERLGPALQPTRGRAAACPGPQEILGLVGQEHCADEAIDAGGHAQNVERGGAVGRRRIVTAAIELEGEAGEGEDRVAHGRGRSRELIEQDARGCGQVRARGRGDLLRRLLERLRLPQARLEERRIERRLQLRVAQGVHVRRAREEAKEEGHAQVGHRQILEEELGFPRAEGAVKRGELGQMKDVILARALAFSGGELELIAQLGAEERRRVRRRGWRARLVGEPDQPAPEAGEPRVLTLVLDLLLERRGRQVAPEARDDETLARLVAP